jgi:hypothetical protein
LLGWILNGLGRTITGVGDTATKIIRVTKGDETQREEGRQALESNVHDEQMAVLASHAAEFAGRPPKTKWDSFVDGLSRLPRPLITLWIVGMFFWPFFDLDSFIGYMVSMDFVPEEIWTLFLAVIAFWFGSRIVSEDIRKPRLTPEQREKALEIIREREKAIIEARTPLVVTTPPTRKPPAPAWALEEKEKALEKPAPKLPDVVVEPALPPPPGKRPEAIDAMISALIKKEGTKYVNDPADSGGPTKYGITWRTLSAWRGTPCWEEEVKALTRTEAEEIYRKEYYFGPSIDTLPEAIQSHCLDISCNSGPQTAIMLLQETLNTFGAGIRVDGIVGQATRAAIEKYDLKEVNNSLVDRRKAYYHSLVASKPKNKKWINGWLKRAESFRMS